MTKVALDTDEAVLALTMLGEARGEHLMGMTDVACVVMNRVEAKTWWGLTPREVCLKPKQFSCWNANDPNRDYLLNLDDQDPLYQQALEVAQCAVAGTLPDRTGGATFYYRAGTATPFWAVNLKPCFIDGHHLFFKGIF